MHFTLDTEGPCDEDLNEMKNYGIIINNQKEPAVSFSRYLIANLAKNGINTWRENDKNKDIYSTDLLIVLGGDGTMLTAFQRYGHLEIPFLCVNFGKVGFLSSLEPEELTQYWQSIVEGTYKVEERSALKMTVREDDQKNIRLYALNDVVIRTKQLRVSHQLLLIDGQEFCSFEGDGLIVATSTGSSAYSLSAGGAIVEPQIDCILVRPICSRAKYLGTLILSINHKLKIEFKDEEPCVLFVDGEEIEPMSASNSINIELADFRAKLVILKPERYFNVLSRQYTD